MSWFRAILASPGWDGVNLKKGNDRESIPATLCHLAAFTGLAFPLANIVAPLLIWLFWRKKSEFVDYHGKESVNFQISLTIWFTLLVVLSFALAFHDAVIFAGGFLGLLGLLFCCARIITAAASAKRGEYSTYPAIIRILKFKPKIERRRNYDDKNRKAQH